MSDEKKQELVKEALDGYQPVEVGDEEAAEQVRQAIDERGFLGNKFELEGTWYAQAI